MRADKWLEVNLVGLVILVGLAFVAAKLLNTDAQLTAVQSAALTTAVRLERIEQALPNASATQEKQFQDWLDTRSRNHERQYALSSADAIEEAAYVPIDGIDQWVTIRGEHRDNPVLLFLHGGPGDATNPWSYPYLAAWEKAFTVVQWDQRGAGRTLERNGAPAAGTLTIAQLVQDGLQLSEYLRGHLHQGKIILVGQSWGAVLAVLMVKARPELFSAFVGTGQIVDPPADERAAYQAVLATAQAAGDSQALASLKAIGPPPYGQGTSASQLYDRWLRACEGSSADAFLSGRIGLALTAPGYTLQDVDEWIDGRTLSAQDLDKEEHELAPRRLAGTFAVPVFVFQGAHDCSSPASLAMQYVNTLEAPMKAFVTIPNAGHYAVFTHSDEFLRLLLERVRPLALSRQPRRDDTSARPGTRGRTGRSGHAAPAV